jgi:surface antigen
MLCLLLVVCGASRASAGHKHQHHRPHRQALGGAKSEAPVPITAAPSSGGKGGGADPGNDYPARWRNAPQDSVLDAWMEYNRECTSFVAWALHSRNGFDMPFYRNANRWGPEAQRRGYVVNSVPAPGSVAWSNTGVFGHVAYVVAVNGANVTVEEYNFTVRGGFDKRAVSADAFTGFIHFKDLAPPVPTPTPPASETTTPVAPTTPLTGTESKSPLPTTFTETTFWRVQTWSDYNFPRIEFEGQPILGEVVQVTCVVGGAPDYGGNIWWYRIASSPWDNKFYARAVNFLNGGTNTESTEGDPPVDPAVPSC